MDKIEELKSLRERMNALKTDVRGDVLTRMTQIVQEMNTLYNEGDKLADASGLEFNLQALECIPDRYYSDISYRREEGRLEDWNSSSADC